MKVSEQWLREWVDPPVDSAGLAHQLTMAGLEVDATESAAPAFSRVVVGEVLEVRAHPNAEKLKSCRVRIDARAVRHIVCGAANVAEGMRVPTALVGAWLPGEIEIRRSTLRGVESQGMLCSAAELGLAEHADGLMRLPETAPVGEDLRKYLDLDDVVFTLELTPNRGDCLSIQGVAREVAAINKQTSHPPDLEPVAAAAEYQRGIAVEAEQACPHYAGRVIDGLDGGAQTPLWLQERLRRSGLRPVNAVVDVTNYVMLELGQPLHAFDDKRLSGDITVRMAGTGERLQVLAGDNVELDERCLVIADASGAVALAGVMGGAASAVTSGTRRVFLESAYFTPLAVAGRGREFKLHTDALHRYERGVDPNLQVTAMERATRLLTEIAGGRPGPVVAVDRQSETAPEPIVLRRSRIERLLGTAIESNEIKDILQRLNLYSEGIGPGSWRVRAPGYRHDIKGEADLVEEIARLHGYDHLPARKSWVESQFRPVPESTLSSSRVCEVLVQRGYQEAITYAFSDPALTRVLNPEASPVPVDNPIADTLGEMRTSLWTGLLPAWTYNLQRQRTRVRLFEIGRTFSCGDAVVREETALAGLISGSVLPEQWGAPPREADFFDMKGDVEALFALSRETNHEFRAEHHPALHPGQSARIDLDGEPVGWCGRLHPRLEDWLGVKRSCLLFEIKLDVLTWGAAPAYRPVHEFPYARRDLALVVDDSVSAAEIAQCFRAAGESILVETFPFDLYRGQPLEENQRSIAFGLIFQDNSRTLRDSQVDAAVRRLCDRLANELGANVRG